MSESTNEKNMSEKIKETQNSNKSPGKNINTFSQRIRMLEPWKRKKILTWFLFFGIVGIVYLSVTGSILYKDKAAENSYWESGLKDDVKNLELASQYSANATEVTVGTYIENLKEVNVKSSYFRIVFNCWFKWEGDDDLDMANNFRVYNGLMNKKEILEEVHEDGQHYQMLRVDATVQKNYWIVRFPLESYQMRLYIEPNYAVDRITMKADTEYSAVNQNLNITGFDLKRHAVSVYTMKYDSTLGNPNVSVPVAQELCTSIEINRSGFGLFLKCFIALCGTITWVFITLFLCTYHRVDPLGMIPAALFGTVTNIMVGANLLPDALQVGLLEYVTFGGIMVIIFCAISVINVNRIRNKNQDGELAFLFGRVMFTTLLVITIAGIIMYPFVSYMR